jgi:cob(I)alamin adenosyltransferase
MKIYTKTGDKGETSLIGGKRVPKHHIRIEAYGAVDELIAFIGLLRDQDITPEIKENLFNIQDRLMVCAAILAADCDDCKVIIPTLHDNDILFLEQEIDKMNTHLTPLHSFIIPGGHKTASYCHIIRTICRRSEREIIKLKEHHTVPDLVLTYINRLSDYFFTLSRKFLSDYQAFEQPWVPKL